MTIGKIVLAGVGLCVLILIGAVGTLMMWDAPPPVAHVEKVLPDARFPR